MANALNIAGRIEAASFVPLHKIVTFALILTKIAIGVLWVLPLLKFHSDVFLGGAEVPRFSGLLVVSLSFIGYLAGWHFPSSYFELKNFENNTLVYERLGVHHFKRFVRDGNHMNNLLRWIDPGYKVIRGKQSLFSYCNQTRINEKAHIALILMAVPPTIYASSLGWENLVAYILVINIPTNVYPIMVQRYLRSRMEKLLRQGHFQE